MRRMRRGDIDQVVEIDREAFPGSWPVPNYRRELENRLAHYLVVCDESRTLPVPEKDERPVDGGFPGLVSRVWRLFDSGRKITGGLSPSNREYITGFIGIWVLADESHLTNIAVRELDRRQGVGERLLISIIDLSMELKTSFVTLEVRASNTEAQKLYTKYGFNQVGVRRHYYTDNREDALLMTTDGITTDSYQTKLQYLKQLHAKKWGVPLYRIAQ